MEDILIESGLHVLEHLDEYIDLAFENGIQFQQPIDVNIIPEDTLLAWMLLDLI